MLITLDATDHRPIYQQIVDEIRRVAVVGSVDADEALPSVRQLAAQLRVNPNTVSQAYQELERQGVVHVRRGQGTYLSESNATVLQRRSLGRDVAARALRDAYRNGVGPDELIQAIRKASTLQKNRGAR